MILATSETVVRVFQVLFYVAIAVAIFIFSNYQNRLRRQRSRDMQMLGLRLGFENFNPNRDDIFARGWGFLSRLSQGNERYAFNLLRGTYQEQPLFVFDYHFQTGSGKSKKEHYCTIFMLIEKEVFPQVTIRPENLRERIAMALGIGNEIQFESAEFSKTFSVRSNDKKFAYDVCNAQMMEYLLANQDLQIEIQGPVISLAFEPQLPVGRIEFNLQRLAQIRSLLPKYIFTNA